MCWVALDRAVRLASKRSLAAPTVEWAAERDPIAEDVWSNFRHPEKGHFVQVRGGREVDASLFTMPLMRFASATDPVWLSTLDAIRDELSDDGTIKRYRTPDGLPGEEGSFSTCSFWYVECLARARRLEEAHLAMEEGLQHANHLGLFSEDLIPTGEQSGTSPRRSPTSPSLVQLTFSTANSISPRSAPDNPRPSAAKPYETCAI